MSNKTSRRKSIVCGILMLTGLFLLAIAGLYAGVAYGYRDKFMCGTYVNGLDVGRRTADDVKAMLANIAEDYTISFVLRGMDGTETFWLNGEDFGLHYVSGKDVDALLERQNAWEWPKAYMGTRWELKAGMETEYEEPSLRTAFKRLLEGRKEYAPMNARYMLRENGSFAIIPEREGNKLLMDAACEAVLNAVAKREKRLDLSFDKWYEPPTIRATDDVLVQEVEHLNAFLDKAITVSMPDGNARKIRRQDLIQCLSKSKGDRYTVSEDLARDLAVREADAIGAALDGTTSNRVFTSTLRGTVQFQLGQPAGVLVDRERTASAIVDAVLGTEDASLEPFYSLFSDTSDLAHAGTYIEVDKQNQMIFVYVNGDRKLESPCVTGLASNPALDTPEGMFFIIDIQHDIHLRGYDSYGNVTYDSPVKYWMQFTYESDGFHDASWRSHFGGSDYLTIGSHGCVNLPLQAAESLYKLAYVGMPVYVF